MTLLRLLAVGDITLETGNDKAPFAGITPILRSKDLLFGNLETVLSRQKDAVQKAISLISGPDAIVHLKEAGFDVLNIANNHILDSGTQGFVDTLNALRSHGIGYIGGGDGRAGESNVLIERNGVSVGFLGYYTYGERCGDLNVRVNRLDRCRIIQDIEDLKSRCHVVVVSLHWGIERVHYPSPEQIEMARALVDAGAHLIIGHHPHVVQALEKYSHGLIAYSLGNRQFPVSEDDRRPERRRKTDESLILEVVFDSGGIESYRVIPIWIDHDFVPQIADKESAAKMLLFLNTITRPVTNGEITRRWWFEEIAGEYLAGNWRSFVVRIKKYGLRHLFQCLKWLISPFVLRCYMGWLRAKIRGSRR